MSTIIGELVLRDENYHFQFEDFLLQIHKVGTDTDALEAMIEAFSSSPKKDLPETLMGICYPDGHKILFMQLSSAGFSNNVKKISVGSYFEIKPNTNFPLPISQITLSADELNSIYPPSQMYSYTLDDKGMISKMNFERPKQSFEWKFNLDNHEITASSGYSHSYRWGTTPIQINSLLYFGFEPTDDYEFVLHVFDLGNRLLQYLCFRQNINCSDLGIYVLSDNGNNVRIGSFYAKWMCDQSPETNEKNLKKCIPYHLIGSSMGNLLQRFADSTLYYRHFPYNSKDERRITPARTIMLTAAFEWEYRQFYLNGNKPNKNDYFKKRLARSLSDFSDCIEIFAKRLYSVNSVQYSIDSAAEKVKNARHAFAHGDITMHYDLETLLGIAILPYLIYAMQLRSAGMSNDAIKHSINHLFGLQMM